MADPLQNLTVIVPGSKWSDFLSQVVLQEIMALVFTVFLQLRIKVYVDDIKIHVRVVNRVVK